MCSFTDPYESTRMARGFVLRGIAGVRRELQCPAGGRPAQRSIWMARVWATPSLHSADPALHCHPERSDPIFSCALQFGASGRGVEGSLFTLLRSAPLSSLTHYALDEGNQLICCYALGWSCFVAPRRHGLLKSRSQPRDLFPFLQQFFLLESAFRPRLFFLRLPAGVF